MADPGITIGLKVPPPPPLHTAASAASLVPTTPGTSNPASTAPSIKEGKTGFVAESKEQFVPIIPSRDEDEESSSENGDALNNPNGNPESNLPPVDGGKEAWLFLAASFVVEALVWGMYPSHFSLSLIVYIEIGEIKGDGCCLV